MEDVLAGRPQSQPHWNEENDSNLILLFSSYFFSGLNSLTCAKTSSTQRQQDTPLSCGQIHQKLEKKQGVGILKNPFFFYFFIPWPYCTASNILVAQLGIKSMEFPCIGDMES